MKKIYVILYPGCIPFEVNLAAELLSKNYQIINVSPDGNDLPNLPGLPLKVNGSYSSISMTDCAGILVPGGNPESIILNEDILKLLKKANSANLTIGAICAGPSILGKAGILVGKKIAHGYNSEQLEFLKDIFKGVEVSDELFVADNNILTAKPQAHIEFAVEVACRLGCVEASKAGRLKEYYRGTLGRKIRPLSLAVLKNKNGQYLFHKAFDKIKNESFYRPLGGGIEFNEDGKAAIARELFEEIGQAVVVGKLIATFENIFTFEGKPGHEIILLFQTEFSDAQSYDCKDFNIVESGKVAEKAVWRSLSEIKAEGSKIYPLGIESFL